LRSFAFDRVSFVFVHICSRRDGSGTVEVVAAAVVRHRAASAAVMAELEVVAATTTTTRRWRFGEREIEAPLTCPRDGAERCGGDDGGDEARACGCPRRRDEIKAARW
jgi:hypothetical protein